MMKVLVTGASGNVGSYVTRELVKVKERVVVANTNTQKFSNLFGKQVESIYFDFQNQTTFDKALESVDGVFFMRPPHLGKPEDLHPIIDVFKSHNC